MKLTQAIPSLFLLLSLTACDAPSPPPHVTSTAQKTATGNTSTALAEQLRAIVRKNIEATQREDLGAVMSTLHPQSPARANTETQMKQIFESYDLEYKALMISFVGQSEDYAITHVKQRTTKKAGPAFKPNVLDAFWVFRRVGDSEDWKLWTQANAAVTYE